MVPLKTTSSVSDRFALAGAMLASVGAGLLIVNCALVAEVSPVLAAWTV